MFDSVLIANRGEIARRIIRTARRMGVRSVAVYSDADEGLPYVSEADEAVRIGPAAPAQSYLDAVTLLEVARKTGAAAVHPGYGFLAENAGFARAVTEAGLVWIGPSPAAIDQMGDKIRARNLMAAAGVPVAPGTTEPVADADAAVAAADQIGYPVMVKAAAGGGGIGMSAALDADALRKAFETARTRAERFFGSPEILLERYLPRARHVEVQILGLADGRVVALGERDCSVQRRHQKVAEETPSPGISAELRAQMLAAAVRAGEAVGYLGAGTVECLVDAESGTFVFLEMNTRLQVEHPVTELVTGIDLVEQQFLIAAGEPVSFDPSAPVILRGHAIELRVYAEDPKRFLPSPGAITAWQEPSGPGVRVDSGYAAGTTVTPFYDPLLAKLCAHGATRDEAIARARLAVADFVVTGPKTNLPFHAELLGNEEFVSGDYDTGLIGRMRQA
ncbi:MAG TPA: biotin carboxylase N-terminal domain-containing protein [Trebonia sp.]